MNKIKFLFGIHNHQPVGNFDHVFEEVYEKCYRPYFEVLSGFPELKTAVHFSGPLLEWLKANKPDYLKMIRGMAGRGHLEIMSGGFYEPLLSTLPEEDAVGQIRMMNDFIREEFDFTPQGLWLAERIWNPELPKIISTAGIRYTVVDDTHFYYSGLEESRMQGYFITERTGHPLFVFPISKPLRYAIPFKMPEETLAELRRAKDELGFTGVTYADDGEKFGSWPETHQWVYTEKWLEKFFTALRDNADWVETTTFAEYIDRHPPTGRVYLPMASYEEMMEWSLTTGAALKFKQLKEDMNARGIGEDRFKLFLRGGQWDNFLTKYEESNHLHKRMLLVSRKVKLLDPNTQQSSGALKALYRGQCNCAQWHGLFGGLYLNYLRHALYHDLIHAENIADAKLKQSFSVQSIDFNLDGREEVWVANPKMSAFVAPAYGGALLELDYRPACFNLSNVLRRREETYHQSLKEAAHAEHEDGGSPQSIHDRVKFKEGGLSGKLFFDRWERYSFLDHFLAPETTLEDFKRGAFHEAGDFTSEEYEVRTPVPGRSAKEFAVNLSRRGRVESQGTAAAISIQKGYHFSRSEAEIRVQYRIVNESERAVALWWGVEFNFTLLAGDAPDRFYFQPGQELAENRMVSEGELPSVASFGLRDDWQKFGLLFTFKPEMDVWRFPVETISQSEDGIERNYQGSCLLAHRKLNLEPGKSCEQTLYLKIS